MQHSFSRRFGGAIAAAAVAIGTVVALAPTTTAAAAPAPGAAAADRVSATGATPRQSRAAGGVGTASSSNRSVDMTLDGIPDITARNRYTGHLNVYPHSGTFEIDTYIRRSLGTFPTVQSTSYGWNSMTWIGTGYVTGSGGVADAAPDVLARTSDGRLLVYPHSGSFANYPVVNAPILVGHGWNINDLISLDDWDGDGFDDIVARRAGTDHMYLYRHSGSFNGFATYPTASLEVSGVADAVWHAFGDYTGDGLTDLLAKFSDGALLMLDFSVGPEGESYLVGTGWWLNDKVSLVDVNGDGYIDVLGRNIYTSDLSVYPHTGSWDTGNTQASLDQPVVLGSQWYVNDIIT